MERELGDCPFTATTQLLAVAPAKAVEKKKGWMEKKSWTKRYENEKKLFLQEKRTESLFGEFLSEETAEKKSMKTNPFKISVTLVPSSYCLERDFGTA